MNTPEHESSEVVEVKKRLRVAISLVDGNLIRINPVDYLGSDRFDEYREAIDGSRYDRPKRANFATLDKLDSIIARLRHAAFDAELDAAVHKILSDRHVAMWQEGQAAEARIRAIDDDMCERTGRRMFPYQQEGVFWLTRRMAALLADEPGLGKTLQTIVAIPANVPVVIICPASLKGNWVGEIEVTRPSLKPTVLKGRKTFEWPEPGQVIIANYDILPPIHISPCEGFLPDPPLKPCPGCMKKLVFESGIAHTVMTGHLPTCKGFLPPDPPLRCPGCHPILKQIRPGTVVVVDEGQKAKSSKSQRGLATRCLCRVAREAGGRSWVLTGTPLESEPLDLWYVMQAAGVAEECFGTRSRFIQYFNGHVLDTKAIEWGVPGEAVVERMQRGSLRRMRRDVQSQIPAALYQEVRVEIDSKTLKECDKFLQQIGGIEKFTRVFEESLGKDKIPFAQIAAVRASLAKAKIPALLELVKEYETQGEAMIVFSMHRSPIDVLEKLEGWTSIHGDVPAAERTQRVADFQAGKYKGIACTIKAAGTGLTLTRAVREIFVDQSYVPADNEQAEARAIRIGQDRSVVIDTLKANHILDERIVEILARRRQIITASVDASTVAKGISADVARQFNEHIQQMQEELAAAAGKPARTMATSTEELAAFAALHELSFESRVARLATDLAEQAERRGLTKAQWRLAIALVKEGKEAIPVPPDNGEKKPDNELDEDDGDLVEDRDAPDCGDTDEERTEQRQSRTEAEGGASRSEGSPATPERSERRSRGGRVESKPQAEPDEVGATQLRRNAASEDTRMREVLQLIESLNDQERGAVFESLSVFADAPDAHAKRIITALKSVFDLPYEARQDLIEAIEDEYEMCLNCLDEVPTAELEKHECPDDGGGDTEEEEEGQNDNG